jgi:hypothetical protein
MDAAGSRIELHRLHCLAIAGPHMSKARIKFDRLTSEDLQFLKLDSPGYFIAKDAEAAGELAGANEIVEVICLANKLYDMELRQRLVLAVSRLGASAIDQFADVARTEEEARFLVDALGKERLFEICRETMAWVRGVIQNDAPQERAGG